MQAELENYKSNEVNLNVSEDISILYIVQHELLNQKEVEFAGVVLKHQLKEDFSFCNNLIRVYLLFKLQSWCPTWEK